MVTTDLLSSDGIALQCGRLPRRSIIKAARKAEWGRLMQQHENPVHNSGKGASKAGFSIEDARGQYIIKCGALASSLNQANEMRLRITRGPEGWMVSSILTSLKVSCFSVKLPGMLHLAPRPKARKVKTDQIALTVKIRNQRRASAQRKTRTRRETRTRRKTRAPKPISTPKKTKTKTPKRTDNPRREATVALPSAKTEKLLQSNHPLGQTSTKSQWRGTESGEDEIQLDPNNKHVDYLELLNELGVTFKGTACFGFLGKKIRFHDYKIGRSGRLASQSWSDFSMAAYEEARVRRWR